MGRRQNSRGSGSGSNSRGQKNRGGGRRRPQGRRRRRRRRGRSGRGGRGRSLRRHYDSSSESSDDEFGFSSSSDGGDPWGSSPEREESNFRRYQDRRERKNLAAIRPVNMASHGGLFDRASRRDIARADAEPVEVDKSVTWDSVGGLEHHVAALKEMVMLPLLPVVMILQSTFLDWATCFSQLWPGLSFPRIALPFRDRYPEVFDRFGVQAPRGVLFYGPPGTGKTLVARALANTCRSGGTQVAFFMRKGADCLSKWVGEAERQLRLLFEQAKAYQPSIVFFDEIDGLAPVRSSKQDQIHSPVA